MRVAINGFGRVGRTFFRIAFDQPDIDIVAINDIGDIDNLAYLLRYDTNYGTYDKAISVNGDSLVVEGKKIAFLSEKDPAKLPWGDMDVDITIESTGLFRTKEKASAHLDAGSKRVVISAPADNDIEHVLVGANQDKFNEKLGRITSDASCTTNAAVPLVSIFQVEPGIEKAMLNTVHGYTTSQNLVDGTNKKDFRRGRAAAVNIVPSHTGAAEATVRSQPWLKDIFDAVALRVPIPTGSIVDLTFIAKKEVSVDDINDILRSAARQERWKDIFSVTEEPLVSSDIIGNHHASIADLSFTRVVGGTMVKVLSWYDNEWGYAHTLMLHVLDLKPLL